MTKYQKITETYENALGSVTQSTDAWTTFLRSACRNYKLKFDEQLLIYAQRPDATAVLEFVKWNDSFGRRIKRGAKGIAVFDGQNGRGALKHYFDISDTYAGRNAKDVPIWSVTAQNTNAVAERLKSAFELNDDSDGKAPNLAQTLIESAKTTVEDSFERYFNELSELSLFSGLPNFDKDSLQIAYKSLLENSVAYMLLTRCGLDASRFIDERKFQYLSNFNSRHAIGALGNAVSEISEECLREVAAIVQNRQKSEKRMSFTFDNRSAVRYNERENKGGVENETAGGQNSRQVENNQGNSGVDNVSPSGGRDVTGLRERRDKRGTNGVGLHEVRTNAQEIFARTQTSAFLNPQNDADLAKTSGGSTVGGNRQNGDSRETDGEGGGRDGGTQSQRSNEVGRPDEQHSGAGGGNYATRDSLRINEQVNIWGKAENSKSPVFSISQQIIDEVLTSGGNSERSPHKIVSIMKKGYDTSLSAAYLMEEYGEGGKGFIIGKQHVSVWFDSEGIRIAAGNDAQNNPNATLIDWEQAATRTRELLNLGRFMPQLELDKVDGYELSEIAERLWQLNNDLEDGAKLDFISADLFKGGFPESVAKIAELLANRDELDKIVNGFDSWIGKYLENESVLNFKIKKNDPIGVLAAIYGLQEESLQFTSQENFGINNSQSQFITQDEVDKVLIEYGSGVEGGKYRIYNYFLKEHTTEQKAAFLREEYGTGGYGQTRFNESHSANGLHIRRGNIFQPYDKISLSWNKVAERIDALIADGQYMSQSEIGAIGVNPDHEKSKTTPPARKPDENINYALQLGSTVFIGTNEYEINELGAEKVVLSDANLPLFTIEMERDEFNRKLRENPLNDGLIKVSVQTEQIEQR